MRVMCFLSCVLSTCCLVLAFAAAQPQEVKLNRNQSIDLLLERYHALGQLDGVVLVAKHGKELYSRAFGLANREWDVPHRVSSRFSVASITKTFTATVCLRLMQRGQLNLDGVIADYLPDYPNLAGKKITLRQLLTHTSGMAGDIGDFPISGNRFPAITAQINADFFSLDELVAIISQRQMFFEPGLRYNYSSDGYAVLGAILAKVTGKSFEQVLQDELFSPLEMKDSGYSPQTVPVRHLATGYRQTFDGFELARKMGLSPAGGAYSTAHDLLRLDAALWGDQFLTAEFKSLAWKPSTSITAYGWKVLEAKLAGGKTETVLQASGSLPGFYSLFTRMPGDGYSVIILSNVHGINFKLAEITQGIVAIMRGEKPDQPRKSLALLMAERIRERGISAIAECKKIHSTGSKEHEMDEVEFNNLGYHFLQRSKPREAIEIFQWNTEAFPQSWNAFDSLGEGYLSVGDTANAILHYERSVQLNPKNENGIAVLKKLKQSKQE